MKSTTNILSQTRINRLRVQGYTTQSPEELASLAFGIRFAYRLCTVILATALLMKSIPLLIAMTVIAFSTVFLPYHPFDYIYNMGLSKWMKKPKLPPRAPQLTFACATASVWLASVTILFFMGMDTAGYILGGAFTAAAAVVSTTDYCMPSTMYAALFLKNK